MELDWTLDAACKSTQKEEPWFTRSDEVARDLAERYCKVCPVFDECEAYALKHGPEFGVWAGMTPGQIRYARRKAS